MKMSGAYYRQSAAAVLAAFETGTSGLTNSEASTRKLSVDDFKSDYSAQHSVLMQAPALYLRFIMLLGGAVAAIYFDQLLLAALLFIVVICLGLAVGFYERLVVHGRTTSRLRMPSRIKVVRAGKLRNLKLTSLVPGDIVYLKAGDIVPADLRIVKSSDCIASETIFDSQTNHQLKNSRVVADFAAPDRQTCSLFFGTNIIRGEAYGVATAVGAHTLLAQLLGSRASAKPSRIFSKRVAARQKQLDLITLLLAALIGLMALANGFTATTTITLLGLLLIASSMLDWYVTQLAVAARRAHSLGLQSGAKTNELTGYETIASSRVVISDLTAAFVPVAPTLRNFIVGKASYRLDGDPLTQQRALSLQLPYTTARLVTEATNGDDFVPMTKRLPSLEFGTYHYSAGLPEQFSNLSGGVWVTNDQTFVAATGSLLAILDKCSDIWDHGHVRPLTKADKAALLMTAAKYDQTKALAYAASVDAAGLVLLGYANFSSQPEAESFAALTKLKKAHLSVVLTSDESSEKTKQLLAKTGFKPGDYNWLNHQQMKNLAPADLASLINGGVMILNNVSVQDIERVIIASQLIGPVMLSGERLEQPNILAAADVIIARPGNITSDYGSILLPKVTLASLLILASESRTMQHQLNSSRSLTRITLASSLLITWFSVAGLVISETTPLITPAALLFVIIISSLPLQIATGWQFTSGRLMLLKPATVLKSATSALHQVIISLSAALVALGAGLLFLRLNHLTAHYLTPTGQTYAKAVTITAVTFGLCLLANMLVIWLRDTESRKARFSRSLSGVLGGLISLGLLSGLIYYGQLHELFSTSSLAAQDLLIVAVAVVIFSLISLLSHFDMRQTRRSVLSLQKLPRRPA